MKFGFLTIPIMIVIEWIFFRSLSVKKYNKCSESIHRTMITKIHNQSPNNHYETLIVNWHIIRLSFAYVLLWWLSPAPFVTNNGFVYFLFFGQFCFVMWPYLGIYTTCCGTLQLWARYSLLLWVYVASFMIKRNLYIYIYIWSNCCMALW